jgi:hypothetical protein
LYYNNVTRRGEGVRIALTTLEQDRRGWNEQGAKDFIKEVERLKELWYSEAIKSPEVSTKQVLANIRDSYNASLKFEKENEERRAKNERRRQERLRKIKEENKNLEWPKPDRPFKILKSSDYWKNGCLYCSYYKPQTAHDYEVHIVTKHHGKPAYPGPGDLELYELI